MPRVEIRLDPAAPAVVGSFGSPAALAAARPDDLRGACDLAEIRLDVLAAAGVTGAGAWAGRAISMPPRR